MSRYLRLWLFLCIIVFQVVESSGRSTAYYDIVNYITEGNNPNLYDVLQVDRNTATNNDIRKAFRKLSLEYHPDKQSGNEVLYKAIVFAQTVLSNPDSKAEYDTLLQQGVPTIHAYYGQYAYKHGAPNVAAEYVIIGIAIVVSFIQYLAKYQKHVYTMKKVKETQRYKAQLEIAMQQGIPLPEIKVYGAEMPQIQDLLLVKLISLPYLLPKFLYNLFKGIVRDHQIMLF